MSEKEYLYLLCQVPGLGAVSLFRLQEQFGNFKGVWHAEEKSLRQANILTEKRVESILAARTREKEYRKDYESMMQRNIQFTAFWEEEYPPRLRPYRDRPAAIFRKGRFPADGVPTAAIVGARNCTEYGRQMAQAFGEELSRAGVQIISGLALGVDGAAHRGALKAGGSTFAVLGCGINICYPKEHYELFCIMEERGGLLTEFPNGTRPAPMNFPVRNRIISALSDAVIIIEAREKSGSLITADLALEQGKEVFALPGRITDPLSGGCNKLLQGGAAVLLRPSDVLEFFGLKYEKKLTLHKNTEKRLAKNENLVYSCLDSRPKHFDEILSDTGLGVTECMECLMRLELAGLAGKTGNQYYCRKM